MWNYISFFLVPSIQFYSFVPQGLLLNSFLKVKYFSLQSLIRIHDFKLIAPQCRLQETNTQIILKDIRYSEDLI